MNFGQSTNSPSSRKATKDKEEQMKAVVILVGTFALLLAITTMAVQPSSPKGQIPEEQIQAELKAQAEKLDNLTPVVELAVDLMTFDGKVTKSNMNQLQKLVNQYKNIPLYKGLKKEIDPESFPSLYLLTKVERATELYFPSLGHSCDKECLAQVRFIFSQLGADVKTVEPNTGPRDILIFAIAGFIALALFMYHLFRNVIIGGKLKERLDKEKIST